MAGKLRDREVSGPGVRLIFRSGTLSKLVQAAIVTNLPACGRLYLQAAKEAVSLDDHTLEELRRLGHPYGWNAKAKIHGGDDRLVHVQTGKLRSSLKMTAVQQTGRAFGVFLVSDSDHFLHLIYGTSRMRPRRFHEKAYEEIEERVWVPLREALSSLTYRIEVTSGKSSRRK